MKRLFLVFSIGLALIGSSLFPALGSDAAYRVLIGYSPDGRYFAFEQFGIQDGSGFAYSDIFLIDLDEDKWVDGAPFSYQASEEDEGLVVARQKARAAAIPALDGRDISVPAITLTGQPQGAFDVNAHRLDFAKPGYAGAPPLDSDRQSLSLALLDVPVGSDCSYIDNVRGYQLTRTDADGVVRVLHSDTRIPTSRFCPLDYRISEIVLPFDSYSLDHGVVLISVFRFGFEGVDRRFIAVPLR